MTVSIPIDVNGYSTKAVVDSAAMITLVNNFSNEICDLSPESTCTLKGIGAEVLELILLAAPNVIIYSILLQ